MINFRYHIVSLMAVFLALSVGIVLGVTLKGPVNQGLAAQAEQDRQQVQALRTQLDRQNALDNYREAYAREVSGELTVGLLTGRTVALIVMPDAPGGVVTALNRAVTAADGTITHTARISADAFDPAKASAVQKVLEPYRAVLPDADNASDATVLGLAVGKGLLAKQTAERDAEATSINRALAAANLVTVAGRSTEQAELAIVVTAEASEPAVDEAVLQAHVEMDVALDTYAAGVVLAGPNSEDLDGTDVLTARNSLDARRLSTVDVADLASGVTTTVLAGKEQYLGEQGHYGALARAGAPLPDLPVR